MILTVRSNRHIRLLSLTIIAALLISGAMHAVDARILRADANAAFSVWNASDECSQPIRVSKNNTIDVTCDACLTRSGCAIESTTGKCVSVARINATMNVEYLFAGKEHYCDASDNACSLCSADNSTSTAVCRGANGCVCVHQCEIDADAAQNTSSSGAFHVYYVLIGVAFVVTGAIMARMYRVLSTEVVFDRRALARAAHAAKPLTMKLDGWRGFIEKERQEQQEKLEIKLCPTRASEDAAAVDAVVIEADRNLSSASTEEDDESKSDEYVTVTTPRNVEVVVVRGTSV